MIITKSWYLFAIVTSYNNLLNKKKQYILPITFEDLSYICRILTNKCRKVDCQSECMFYIDKDNGSINTGCCGVINAINEIIKNI